MLRSRTLREGSVGLFALAGLILIGTFAVWLRGGSLSKDSYKIWVEFTDVSGLQLGAPVRYRGVDVGKIVGLKPGSNKVSVLIEIASASLRIPRKSTIQTSRYGLIGEAAVDINPLVTLDSQALAINPNSKDCIAQQSILCNQDRLQGQINGDLMTSMAKLSEVYSDPTFVNNLSLAAKSTAQAGEKIAKLSDEMRLLAGTARKEIQGVSETVSSYGVVARDASHFVRNLDGVITRNQAQLEQSITNAAQLTKNLNALVNANRGQLVATLQGVTQTSEELRQVAVGLNQTVKQVNQGLTTVDTQKIAQDLQALIANADATSRNLRDITKNFNDPTLLANLKKTLDSARFTFENVQKITSDMDELTGDPVLRDKVRKLILGLGNLMSSTQQIEQQFYTSQVLDSLSQEVDAQVDYQIDVQQRFATFNPAERPLLPPVSRFSPPPAIANHPLPAQEK